MEFIGKITKITQKSGTSAKGAWEAADVRIEQIDKQFPEKTIVTYLNKPNEIAKVKVGDIAKLYFNMDLRTYQNKEYIDIKGWKIDNLSLSQPASTPAPPTQTTTPQAAPPAPMQPETDFNPYEKHDDLPF